MDLYNRMMTDEFAYKLLKDKEFLFLTTRMMRGDKEEVEKRGIRVREQLNPSSLYEIEYFRMGLSDEEKILDGFRVYTEDKLWEEFSSLRRNDMYSFLEKLYKLNKNLVVDFTLMNTRFLGSFCAMLSMFEWDEVYFCYTEPGEYSKNELDDFDLKNSTMGYEQIPNLETKSDSSEICDWIIFLGFEGSRLMRLEEGAPSSKRSSAPYVSIPAMRTHWHNYALDANREFFELRGSDREKLGYVSAVNPFETYHELMRLRGNADTRLVISPIGTKPVMLGCIMFVLENEQEMILFDNPYQEGSNTIEYGKTHFYDLSQFIHTVKNKRYSEED